ncbi:MAG: AMP-binding protein [Terriglobia bacterium]|nr:AMP-binding protein [Terriglobia bacterium]
MERKSLVAVVEGLSSWGEGPAYAHRRGYRTERWSYGEVLRTARQFARELEARGVAKGDRVVLWGDNSAEWATGFFGCVLRGAVSVPMDRVASDDFAMRVAEQVDAKLMVVAREIAGLCGTRDVLVMEDLRERVAKHDSGPYASPEIGREDMLEIVFTSGTTSEPKGVVISHGNVLANLEPIEREIAKYRKYEKWFHPLAFLNLLPLSHVFGQFLGLFIPQALGATVVFHNSLSPGEIMEVIKHEKVSALIAVPRMLASLRQKLERDLEAEGKLERFLRRFAEAEGKKFLKRMWRFRDVHRKLGWKFWAFISGGAALDADTEKFWNRLGYAVVQGYGLTETTSLISLNHPFKVGQRSIGKVLPGREMKLDENGEILVRGANLAAGYWTAKSPTLSPKDGDKGRATESGAQFEPVGGEEGWFHTGDLGELDAEGNLYFKGRRKNVIVTPAGMKVYPEDLEGALRAQPEVRDCVVVALPVEGNAEPCAVLLMQDGSDGKQAVAAANARLAEFQQIRRWLVWPDEDFPRTSTQKPKIGEIEAYARAKFGAGPTGETPQSALAELIGRVTRKPVEALAPDAKLESDLNLSSIDRVELMSAIEDRYQVSLNEQTFSNATTVAQVEKMLRESPQERPRYEFPTWALAAPLRWLRALVYQGVTWPATLLMTWPRVIARDKLKGVEGPLLIISNHVAYLDIGFLLWALPWRYRTRLAVAMLGELLVAMRHPPKEMNWFQRIREKLDYGLVVTLFNVFPIFQKYGFRESFAFAGEAVDRGYSVVVFPEGRRTDTGEMQPFQSGVGLLAQKLDLPVLPMRIDGLYELRLKKQRFSRKGTITVRIGEPVKYPANAAAESIARDLERRVRNL